MSIKIIFGLKSTNSLERYFKVQTNKTSATNLPKGKLKQSTTNLHKGN